MGATKHKEAEEAVPLHQHSRATNEIKKIDQDLEKQFTESLTSKINRTNHLGLGFGGAGSSFPPRTQTNTHVKFDDNEDSSKNSSQKAGATSSTTPEDPKLKFKKMSFVKSNN